MRSFNDIPQFRFVKRFTMYLNWRMVFSLQRIFFLVNVNPRNSDFVAGTTLLFSTFTTSFSLRSMYRWRLVITRRPAF
jgi:hypothetical protein